MNYYSVFSRHGHHIGYRADCRETDIRTTHILDRIEIVFSSVFAGKLQRTYQLESNANACQILIWISAVRPVRIYHGNGIGQNLGTLMVVCYHHINAEFI